MVGLLYLVLQKVAQMDEHNVIGPSSVHQMNSPSAIIMLYRLRPDSLLTNAYFCHATLNAAQCYCQQAAGA